MRSELAISTPCWRSTLYDLNDLGRPSSILIQENLVFYRGRNIERQKKGTRLTWHQESFWLQVCQKALSVENLQFKYKIVRMFSNESSAGLLTGVRTPYLSQWWCPLLRIVIPSPRHRDSTVSSWELSGQGRTRNGPWICCKCCWPVARAGSR